jgi:hypothetical protein
MMTNTTDQPQPPTYYANFVTSMLTVDDLLLELRRVDRAHRDWLASPPPGKSASGTFTPVPALTSAEIMEHEPIARVVMSFSSAKALSNYLNAALPAIEEARRTGTAIQ